LTELTHLVEDQNYSQNYHQFDFPKMIDQEEESQEEDFPEAVDSQEEAGDSPEVGDTLEQEDPLEQDHLEEGGASHLHPSHKEETIS